MQSKITSWINKMFNNVWENYKAWDRFAYEWRHSRIIFALVCADDWKAILFQIKHT